MDTSEFIHRGLEIVADDSTQANPEGNSIKVYSDDEEIKNTLEELFIDKLDMNNELWTIVFETCKIGDNFYEVVVNDYNKPKNVIFLRYLDPEKVDRIEENGRLSFYTYKSQEKPVDVKETRRYGYESGEEVIYKLQPWQIIHFKLENKGFAPYGASLLYSGLKTYRRLNLLEDVMIVYRLCLRGSSRIWTPGGYKYIRNIRENDIVYSLNDKNKLEETKVLWQENNGKKKLYKVSSMHRSIEATSNHPILVSDPKGNTSYVDVINLKPKYHKILLPKLNIEKEIEIKSNKECACLNNEGLKYFRNKKYKNISQLENKISFTKNRIHQFLYNKRKSLPKKIAIEICEKFNIPEKYLIFHLKNSVDIDKMNLPKIVNEDFAKFFGFMLGDGFITTGNRIGFALGNRENINKKYFDIFSRFYSNLKINHKNKKANSIFASSKEFKNIFLSMGFIPGARFKRIPSWVFEAKRNIQEAFIEGLIDADGHERCIKNIPSCEIGLCNLKLIEDLKELCNRLGWVSGKIRTRKRFGGHIIENNRKMKDTICHELYFTRENLPEMENIISIEEIGEDFTYDIEVENVSHNFIANGVPVHNSRAPERRVFYIDVGNLNKIEAKRFLEKVKNSYRTSSFIDESGNINKKARMLSITNDIFVPVREGQQGTKIETLQGGQALHNIDDMKYFRDKILRTMNIPPAYLGDDADRSRGNLSQLDIKFSRFIERIQSQMIRGLNKIAALELFFDGYKKEKLNDFEIEMTPPSNIKEITEIDLMGQKMNLLASIQGLNIFSNQWMLKNILKLSDAEVADIELYRRLEAQNAPPGEDVPGATGIAGTGSEAPLPGETLGIPAPEPGEAGVAPPEIGDTDATAGIGATPEELAASTMMALLGKDFIMENQKDFFRVIKHINDKNNKKPIKSVKEWNQIVEDLSNIFVSNETIPNTNNTRRQFIINEFGGIKFDNGTAASVELYESYKDKDETKYKIKTILLG